MKIEFIQGEKALLNSGEPLNEGEAFIYVDGKPVKKELIDHFNSVGHYVGDRPTGINVKLIVNLYKVSIEFIEAFNKYVPGLRFTDIEDKEKVVEFALIPLTTHYGNGKTGEAWYISERLKDSLYTNPSKKYLESIQKNNREWAKAEIDNSQCN